MTVSHGRRAIANPIAHVLAMNLIAGCWPHGAQLQEAKRPTVNPDANLAKQDWRPVGEQDGDGCECQGWRRENEQNRSRGDVEGSFQCVIEPLDIRATRA